VFDKFFQEIVMAQATESKPDTPAAAPAGVVQAVLDFARKFLGTPHKMGGVSKKGIDCSGLPFVSFKEAAQVDLPRPSRGQAKVGKPVAKEDLQPGDLVFFATGSDPKRISHVGIITKGGAEDEVTFIHTSTKRGVVEEPLFRWEYWRKAYRHARRVI
jgi:cell wall-associated NlpC family hydrolase